MNRGAFRSVVLGAVLTATVALDAAGAEKPLPVTVDNFIRAESDLYMARMVKDGGFGKFFHYRDLTPIDKQTVIRMNRDTLYSGAVFDLDAGPVTVTLPDPGKRFMTLQVISEDHYTPLVVYKPGPVTITREQVGTRYVLAGIRILVNPSDPADVKAVRGLQDSIKVEQASPGHFEIPQWDPVSQKKVRDALLVLGSTGRGFKGAFGTKADVDPVHHLIGTALGWGGNPERDATYVNIVPAKNDGKTVHRLTVKDVPVDGFWSISVYNAKGYFQPNKLNAYSVNDITAVKAADGSTTVQFGGCDGKIPNCLPITPGWNATVRLYRPRPEILNGTWTFPEPRP